MKQVFVAEDAPPPPGPFSHEEFVPGPYPARTTIQSDLPGFAIEVDAVLDVGG